MQALHELLPEQDRAVTVCLKVDANVKLLCSRMQVLHAGGSHHRFKPQLLLNVSRRGSVCISCLNYTHLRGQAIPVMAARHKAEGCCEACSRDWSTLAGSLAAASLHCTMHKHHVAQLLCIVPTFTEKVVVQEPSVKFPVLHRWPDGKPAQVPIAQHP